MLTLSGCGDDKEKKTLTIGGKAKSCDVTINTLAGTEWLYLNTTPEGTSPDHVMGRMKFHEEGGQLKAKYNARSKSSIYDYECKVGEKRVTCKEKALPADWCRALLAGGGTCDAATLQSIDKDLSAEDAAKGAEKGTAEFEEAKKTKKGAAWKRWKLGNNNVGNKLQGRMYVKVVDRKCELRVTDNYMTIFNGRSMEDSNPNGTNAFAKNEMGELLWENCESDQSENLVGRPELGFPKDPAKAAHLAHYKAGDTVQFTYLGMDGSTPPEGCTFSYDMWLDGKPAKKGLVPGEASVRHRGRNKKVAAWLWAYKMEKASPIEGEYISMIRYTQCGGVKKQVGVACAAVRAQ
jgi:hypothetical protein